MKECVYQLFLWFKKKKNIIKYYDLIIPIIHVIANSFSLMNKLQVKETKQLLELEFFLKIHNFNPLNWENFIQILSCDI